MFSSAAVPLDNYCYYSSSSSSLFSGGRRQNQRRRLLVSRRSLSSNQKWRHSMFVGAKPALKDGTLSFSGQDVLTGVPPNIVVTPLTDSSAYVGATSTHTSSRHVFKIGVIEDIRLLCLFRFKIWWMIPRVGTSGSDIPIETQMLLLEAKRGEASGAPTTSYVVFLPLLDGEFRSSLQGNTSNELEMCVESGDPTIVTSQSLKAVFVSYGDHPFDLMKKSMKILAKQSGTFALHETKQIPGMLDWFGWCTWDAFYHDVNPQGIIDGLTSLSEGGTPARFLIIDDGWQDTTNEFQKEGEKYIEGSEFGGRLVSIEENDKFRKTADGARDGAPSGLKEFVSDIKKIFGLKYVYVWHALMGYWGGLLPVAAGTMKYNPKLRYPVQSPGNLANARDIAMDSMAKYGIGAIDTENISHFYQDLHGYLASQNVDGVKVDVQNILETIATGQGGRVSLTRQFQEALENSIVDNFKDNSIICCMGQSMDSIYQNIHQKTSFWSNLVEMLAIGSISDPDNCTQLPIAKMMLAGRSCAKRSAVTRASDDYYPKNPATQTLHIAAVSFNSIFLGEVLLPDWDMFYSLHDAAEFHAIARAVGGCGIYVSDKPGHHDFNILRRLVLPDGSILRAKFPGRPARDCLFCDPVLDGKSLLKIWNLNKCTGVIGVFNCQGAGSWPCLENTVREEVTPKITGQVSPADIEYFEEASGKQWTGDCAVFSFRSGSLFRLPFEETFHVALKSMECDVFTVSPIKVYNQEIQFAAIGLLNMYNSGGAVESVAHTSGSHGRGIRIKGRGGGRFGAYSNIKPRSCSVNSSDQGFNFNAEDHLLLLTIPNKTTSWDIHLCY